MELKHEPAYDIKYVVDLFAKLEIANKQLYLQAKERDYYARLIGTHTGIFQPPAQGLSAQDWTAVYDLKNNFRVLYPEHFNVLPSGFLTPRMRLFNVS